MSDEIFVDFVFVFVCISEITVIEIIRCKSFSLV